LKPGGRIVYSTCSIDPQENLELVTKFSNAHPELELSDHEQLLPFRDGCDGAFAALLLDQRGS
jgi:16S rRNA (cytosine967-C5)-methyltransferase